MAQTQSASAVVAYAPTTPFTPNWKYETVNLARTEPKGTEVLVRMLAVGICHTDIAVGSLPDGAMGVYPQILGHEGSGYVEAVGPDVKSVQPGDPVLLSYTYCGKCDLCTDDNPVYCQTFNEENCGCADKVWQNSEGKDVGGKFFGQSSYASVSFVDEKSIVNVKGLIKNDDELKLFSPLGCGLMTGSGAIVNTCAAKFTDVVLVVGLGAVGLGAVMAAKIAGCRDIIAVDKVPSRLEIAKQLGASITFNTSHFDISTESYSADLAAEIKALVKDKGDRINYALDTTGFLPVVNACIKALSKRGKFLQIGIPIPFPSPFVSLDFQDLFGGTKRIEVNFLGDCNPRDHLPKMIQWYRESKFPFDKFVKFYPAKDVAIALEEMKTDVIKPVLVH